MEEQQERARAPRRVEDLYEDEKPPTPPPEPEPGPLELKADLEEEPEEKGAIPSWAQPYLPSDFRIPRGKEVFFVRFPSKWTDAPEKGVMTAYPRKVGSGPLAKVEQQEVLSRVLVIWSMNDAEEKHALQRARDQRAVMAEYCKQIIRSVDGRRVDWTGAWAQAREDLISAEAIWKELGPKCRKMVANIYVKSHTLEDKEIADFFLNCLVVTSAVAG